MDQNVDGSSDKGTVPAQSEDLQSAVTPKAIASQSVDPPGAPAGREVIVFGGSHVNAFRGACADSEVAAQIPGIAEVLCYPFGAQNKWYIRPAIFDSQRMVWEPNAAIMSTLFYLGAFRGGPQELLVSAYGGNTHNVIGLREHRRPFDFVYPGRRDLPVRRQAELIPYGMIRSLLSERMKTIFMFLSAIKAATERTMLHIESPPPLRSFARFRQQFTDEGVDLAQLAPAPLRWKLWACHSDLVREFCESTDIIFVKNPDAVMDEDGYLLDELASNPTHGGSRYGALRFPQILKFRHESPLIAKAQS